MFRLFNPKPTVSRSSSYVIICQRFQLLQLWYSAGEVHAQDLVARLESSLGGPPTPPMLCQGKVCNSFTLTPFSVLAFPTYDLKHACPYQPFPPGNTHFPHSGLPLHSGIPLSSGPLVPPPGSSLHYGIPLSSEPHFPPPRLPLHLCFHNVRMSLSSASG